jgi:hypothetical protein
MADIKKQIEQKQIEINEIEIEINKNSDFNIKNNLINKKLAIINKKNELIDLLYQFNNIVNINNDLPKVAHKRKTDKEDKGCEKSP